MVTMAKPKEKIFGRLFRSKITDMTINELRYLQDNVTELYVLLTNTPISRTVLSRQYGVNTDEMDWLVANKEKLIKKVNKEMGISKRRTGVYTTQEITEVLEDNKLEVIGMLKDKVLPSDIFWEFNIIPNNNALTKFKDKLREEGYHIPRNRR